MKSKEQSRVIQQRELTLERGLPFMEDRSSKEAADEARTTVLKVRIFLGFFEGCRGKKATEGEGEG